MVAPLTFEQFLILSLIHRFRGERSASAVYHLLKGKRTAQTIQDGFLYQVHVYFQTLKSLTRQEWQALMEDLSRSGRWILNDGNRCLLTEEGLQALEAARSRFELPTGLDGWFYGRAAEKIWSRLSLLVQTASHLIAKQPRFLPVVRDDATLRWIKGYLKAVGRDREALAAGLYNELAALWSRFPEREATLLSNRLSGSGMAGKTIDQMAVLLSRPETETLLWFQSGLHRTAKVLTAKQSASSFPLLSRLAKDIDAGLTASSAKTYELLKKGLGVEDIARLRRLKTATVQDHIVEIAFCDPEFSIRPFVNESAERLVKQVLKRTRTRRLSAIKQALPADIDYFHIRLVLARMNDRDDVGSDA